MENNLKNIEWQYIVYETTNLINNKIYIGVHKTQDYTIFDGYLGNGIYNTQPYTYQYAKTAFQCAVKKYGPQNFKRKVLAVFKTPEEAYSLEEELVNEQFLKRNDVYNMILGGAGGYYISNRIKVYQYDLEGNYLNEYLSFADAALNVGADYTLISYAVRKKAIAKNSLWSTDKLNKLNLNDYNLGNNHSKIIYSYSIKGDFLNEFSTQSKASKFYNVTTASIRESCILGNCVQNKYYFSYIKQDSYDKARTEYIKTRPVYKYSAIDGNFIQEYKTQLEAECENKNSNISKAIRLKSKDENGFLWSLEKLEKYNSPKFNNKKLVGKFDLNGNLIQKYDSATKAAKENGTSVWKVLSGLNNTHKGYIYRYL